MDNMQTCQVRSFNFTFRNIADILSLNNAKLADFVNRIYPIELEIKDTTDTAKSDSYIDIMNGFISTVPRLVPPVKLELLSLQEHMT